MKFQICGVVFVSLIFFLSLEKINLSLSENDDLIFSINDKPYNTTFAEWTSWWWNKHLSIPDIKDNASLSHPRDQYSSEKCGWAQDGGPVWFLPDGKELNDLSTQEIRKCQIPEGKAILTQIVGSGCSTGEGFKSEQELINCAIWVLPQAQFSAKINGIEVMNTQKNPDDIKKFNLAPFKTNLTYVKDNYYGVEPGTYDGYTAGIFIFVKPLEKGNHTIEFQESAIEFFDGFPKDKRQSNVKYLIEVK